MWESLRNPSVIIECSEAEKSCRLVPRYGVCPLLVVWEEVTGVRGLSKRWRL